MKGTAYLIQGVLVSLWWLGLWVSPSFFKAFQYPGIGRVAFNAFLAPDFAVIALLSLIRAYNNSKALEWVVLGGFAYAALYCMNASILTQGGYLPTTLMLLGLAYNLFLVGHARLFRTSRKSGLSGNVFKTLLQIVCVWGITLGLFPWILVEAFDIQAPENALYLWVAGLLFMLSSLLGLSSANALVRYGEGTPLPADQTQKLVSTGPYRYVRNPMAVAGMGQGLSISIYFASIHLLIYTLLGGLLWHFAVRPLEEKNMAKRFGKAYEQYKARVGLWIPVGPKKE